MINRHAFQGEQRDTIWWPKFCYYQLNDTVPNTIYDKRDVYEFDIVMAGALERSVASKLPGGLRTSFTARKPSP